MPVERFFTGSQWAGLVGLGGLYWGIAAMAIRHFPQTLFGSPIRQLTTFLALLPVGYPILCFSEALLGIPAAQRLVSTSVMSAFALFLDGTAFMWFPAVYENPSLSKIKSPLAIHYSRQGAASILWGVGALLTVALIKHLE